MRKIINSEQPISGENRENCDGEADPGVKRMEREVDHLMGRIHLEQVSSQRRMIKTEPERRACPSSGRLPEAQARIGYSYSYCHLQAPIPCSSAQKGPQ
jgi:hypothetical protein